MLKLKQRVDFKSSVIFFLIFFSGIELGIAQSPSEEIIENNRWISVYNDSLESCNQQFLNGQINEVQLKLKLAEFYTQIGNLIYLNNFHIQPVLDSISSIAYNTLLEAEVANQDSMEAPKVEEEMSNNNIEMDQVDPELPSYPEVSSNSRKFSPMAAVGKVMSMNSGKRTKVGLQFGLYYNNWEQTSSLRKAEEFKLNMFKSFNFFGDISLIWRTRLTQKNSPVNIYYGLGLDNRKFTQTENFIPLIVYEDPPINPLDTIHYDKISLKARYLRIPLGLDFQFKKVNFSVGTYFGFKIKDRRYTWYEDNYGAKIKSRIKDDFGLSKSNYGLSISLGRKKTSLSFNYDLSELFSSSWQETIHPWRLGIVKRI